MQVRLLYFLEHYKKDLEKVRLRIIITERMLFQNRKIPTFHACATSFDVTMTFSNLIKTVFQPK